MEKKPQYQTGMVLRVSLSVGLLACLCAVVVLSMDARASTVEGVKHVRLKSTTVGKLK